MFSIFKKKSEIEKLQDQYAALMKESHALSQKDRSAGDKKFAEAEEIAKQIEKLKLAAS